MKHLYFLAGPPDKARSAIQALRDAGVEPDYIHAVAKDDEIPRQLGAKPATMEEYSDVGSARIRGVLIGGATGLLVGIGITLIPGGAEFAAGHLLLAAALGAILGFVASTIIGSSEEHPIYHEYEQRIKQGDVLVAVDCDPDDVDSILSTIHGVDHSLVVKERTLTQVENIG